MRSERGVIIEQENNKVFGIKGRISYDKNIGGYIVKGTNKVIRYNNYDPKDKFEFKEGERHCDAIVEFFIDNTVKIVFVELKGNHVEDAIEQLQSTIHKLRKEYRKQGFFWEGLSKIAIVVSNSGIAPTTGLYKKKAKRKDIIVEGIEIKIKARRAYLKVDDLVECKFTVV